MSPDEIAASPNLFPIVLDLAGERVAIVRLSEELYRGFSFLDERILPHVGPAAWVPWAELSRASQGLTGECDFIFHIGHVGSTLLSRLLGSHERILSIREPAILRTLALQRVDERLGTFLRLWARVYRTGQKTLLKTTSFASEIAPMLMELSPGAMAILMFVPPEPYVATILGGPNSRLELKANGPSRLERLRRRVGGASWRLETMSEGERAALAWACEMCALAEIAQRFGDRVLWLDFDHLLSAPSSGLAAAMTHLHGEVPPASLAAILDSSDFFRYSKAPEHPYDSALRRRIIAQARIEHGGEVSRGLAWLDAVSIAHPTIARAAFAAAPSPQNR